MPKHVLIVDDDPWECEVLQRALYAADIQALTLTDSRQAAGILSNQTFDAIFLDVKMPPPDGMDLTRQIRASGINRKAPVIMMTGYEDPTMVARGFEAGINFFLYKPLKKDRLLNLVRLSQNITRVEQRRFQRVSVQRKIEMQFEGDTVEGKTIDLSLNGALVRPSRTFPTGSRVRVRLDLSSGRPPLILNALVTRLANPGSMGIHFDSIDMSGGRELQDFLLPLMITDIG